MIDPKEELLPAVRGHAAGSDWRVRLVRTDDPLLRGSVDLMGGSPEFRADFDGGRFIEAARKILLRSASLSPVSPGQAEARSARAHRPLPAQRARAGRVLRVAARRRLQARAGRAAGPGRTGPHAAIRRRGGPRGGRPAAAAGRRCGRGRRRPQPPVIGLERVRLAPPLRRGLRANPPISCRGAPSVERPDTVKGGGASRP